MRASGGYDRERTVVELGSAQVLEAGGEDPPAKAPAAVTGCLYYQTLEGSFSAGSKPMFASKRLVYTV